MLAQKRCASGLGATSDAIPSDNASLAVPSVAAPSEPAASGGPAVGESPTQDQITPRPARPNSIPTHAHRAPCMEASSSTSVAEPRRFPRLQVVAHHPVERRPLRPATRTDERPALPHANPVPLAIGGRSDQPDAVDDPSAPRLRRTRYAGSWRQRDHVRRCLAPSCFRRGHDARHEREIYHSVARSSADVSASSIVGAGPNRPDSAV